MKLYFSPGACSLSPHIALREAGLSFELEQVSLATKKTATGEDFRSINPKGYVPALRLDSGELMTEGVAIVQYVADLVPAARLAPALGTVERYRLMEWLTFVSSEVHKSYSPLFNPKATPEWKELVKGTLAGRLAIVENQLAQTPYLMGDTFTVADAYLFTCLRWSGRVGVELSALPGVTGFVSRVTARPAVHAALQAEGLLK